MKTSDVIHAKVIELDKQVLRMTTAAGSGHRFQCACRSCISS